LRSQHSNSQVRKGEAVLALPISAEDSSGGVDDVGFAEPIVGVWVWSGEDGEVGSGTGAGVGEGDGDGDVEGGHVGCGVVGCSCENEC